MFSDRLESSPRLRFLVLLTALWITFFLGWVTGRPGIPLLASLLLVVGHLTSWRWPRSYRSLRSVAIIVAIVGLPIAMRGDFVSALTGDKLPIAESLLLICGIASFRVETRGGLYAQLALSGLIFFWVSERSFDQSFVPFLIVFLGLFLTFFAMAFIEDQLSMARQTHWPGGAFGRLWFWLGIVGGGLLVCSALAFSLLPADYRGRPGSQRLGVVPFMGELGAGASTGAAVTPLAPGDQDGDESDLTGVGDVPDGTGLDLSALREFAAEDFEGRETTTDPRDTVMHVRSKVTSYWRGRLFDEFDGQTWYASKSPLLGRAIRYHRDYYWQAFFVEQEQPGSLFAGYNPIYMIGPDQVGGGASLPAGTAYSVLSQRPSLSATGVRRDIAGRGGEQHLSLPATSLPLRQMAREIVGDARTPFEQLWRIVSHLRSNHGYGTAAADQLQLSGSIDGFLSSGRAGTSLDFATATVLLARAVGLPARLAVGYLPGRFDPFSGTHNVRRRDAHAWAEVRFARNGWIAFDGTPRPELDVFTSGNLQAFGGNSFIFQTKVGGGLYQIIQSGASNAIDRIADILKSRGWTFGVVAGAIVASLLARIHRRTPMDGVRKAEGG